MEGTGNDFVVVDGIRQQFTPTAAQLRFLADRHFGIGCDQILVVRPPARPGVDFRYEIFNADGGEVQNCGNGARCFVRFVRDLGLTQKTEIRVETLGGIIVPRLEADGQVTVDMGVPRFEPREIPFRASSRATTYRLALRDKEIEISALSLGNPHAVQIVDDAMRVPVASDGPLIENHPAFPERVNAGFMQILNREHIRLRVFERGAGETLACGTGACAAVVAGITRGLLEERVRVTTNGGDLIINWGGPDQPVLMKGQARTVFKGEIEL